MLEFSVTFLQHLPSLRDFRCNFIPNTFQNLHQALVGEDERRRDAWWQLAQQFRGLEHIQAFFASIQQHHVEALAPFLPFWSDHLCDPARENIIVPYLESNSLAHVSREEQVAFDVATSVAGEVQPVHFFSSMLLPFCCQFGLVPRPPVIPPVIPAPLNHDRV